ncbi:putative entry exclusion protein TrbK-alt [Methylocystis heyeri]|uniref:Putative entry exclusion protein TrbK-alt n=1 Tax=Methylocystis heyeri TaxID=391905 RepID=A0A6B8KCB5_9HYPH|nr:putative entry exclusion protein TrbK-alt [Methylocystis heyeri]QGM46064.1 putative entry exclusion protein TrbK-alt [Methylocystis heyeri]
MGRTDSFRIAAIGVLVAAIVAALIATHEHAPAPPVAGPPSAATSDDLSSELRHCSALGPSDAEDPYCLAVWDENRRRFFGRPARPLRSPPAHEATAPATPSSAVPQAGGAR